MLNFKEDLSKKYLSLKKQIVRISKDALEAIESKLAEEYSEANSTVSSWLDFVQSKEVAKAMVDRMDVTQNDVDKVVSELQTALDNLTFRASELSFNELAALINEVAKMESDYSVEMFKDMKEYLDQAKTLVALGTGEVTEKDVQANLTNLVNEKAILISYQELKIRVELAKEILDKEAVDLRPATVKVLQNAYEAGNKLISENSKKLIALQNAKQEINEAIEGLLEIVERKDLDKLLEQVKILKEDDYTEVSWETFKKCYERDVIVNQDLDVDESAIQKAYNEFKQVVVEEQPKVEEKPGTEVSDETKTNAKTGDTAMIFEFAMISFVAVLALMRLRKKLIS